MVLNELGQKLSNALAMVSNAETIDEKVRRAGWEQSTDHPIPFLADVVLAIGRRWSSVP